jgi:hypothetical protein
VHPRESIAYQFERNAGGSRTHHDLILDVDRFGNVLKDLRVVYGRQPGMSPLTAIDKEMQEKTFAVVYRF